MHTFAYLNHTICFHYGIVECSTCSISAATADIVRVMARWNIRCVVVDGQTITRIN